MKLYDLTAQYLQIMDLLVQNDGELSPELEAALEANQDGIQQKAGGYARVIRTLETQAAVAKGQADGIMVEVSRLRKLCQARLKSAERLSAWLKQNMERMGIDRVETDVAIIRIQKNGGKQPIEFEGDPATLPPEFCRVSFELDKDAALRAWAAGQPMPAGFVVRERATRLVIQ